MRILTLLMITASLLSLNCSDKVRTAYFVNVDCSNSTSDGYIREAYRNDFKKILKAAGEGDIIVIDRISSNSFSTSDPLTVKLPEYSIFGANKDKFEKIRDSLKNDFALQSEKYFKDPEYSETDILNSINKSVIYLRNGELKEFRKIIVLFSDMIQETEELDLTENNGDERQIKKIISKLENENKIFNLDSIEVYVSGATYSELKGTQINLRQTKFTKEFWKNYFERCNMKYRDDMYQARLGEF